MSKLIDQTTPTVAQLQAELQALRAEMNAKINRLQTDQNLVPNQSTVTSEKSSRRKLLKKLALVASGAVATGALATQTAQAGYRGSPASGSTSTISYGLVAAPNGNEVWSPSSVSIKFGLIGACDAPPSTDPLTTPTQFNTFTTTAGILGYSVSNFTGVAGHSVGGVGIVGRSNTGLGGDFEGGSAAIRLRANLISGAPTSDTHAAGELLVDNNGQLYLCTNFGTPGTWVKVSQGYTAGSNITLTNNANGTTTIAATSGGGGANIVFLTNPIRVIATTNSGGTTPLLTSDGSSSPNATLQSFQITGVVVGGQSVAAGAKGIIGSLTSVGATNAGNLRLWQTGATPPNVNTLNIPARPDGTGFNLTTAFTVGLSTDGKVSIGYSNGVNGARCGFSIDVVAYIL
jgi:hypothetical protein